MKCKKLFYLKIITKISIILVILLGLKNSSFKVNTYSSNENVNKNVNLSTMAVYINKEEEKRIEEERIRLEEEQKQLEEEQKLLEEEKKRQEEELRAEQNRLSSMQTYGASSLDSYTGDLTGYEAFCPLCSGKLACMSSLDLSNGKNTYEDKTFGVVNIVASSKNLPCGSIITFKSLRISENPIIAIVLDRGVGGNNIDFLAPSEEYALKYIGRSSITYDVLRFGWD